MGGNISWDTDIAEGDDGEDVGKGGSDVMASTGGGGELERAEASDSPVEEGGKEVVW